MGSGTGNLLTGGLEEGETRTDALRREIEARKYQTRGGGGGGSERGDDKACACQVYDPGAVAW